MRRAALMFALLAGCTRPDQGMDPPAGPPAIMRSAMPIADAGSTAATTPDAGTRDAMAATASAAVRVDAAVAPLCVVGQVTACACPGGKPGTQVCIGPDGKRSECGCATPAGPDIFVPPKPPEMNSCGGTMCGPYPQESTSASAHPCCAMDGRCGSTSDFLFGKQCLARGGPRGVPSSECKDEFPNFLDLYGCCRPDGRCGLSIDHVPNWDLGCVERSEMARLLNDGATSRNFLSLIFLLPVKKAEFAPVSCAYKP